MPKRLAGVSALVVFAFCLVLGMRADNTFSTTITRALVAMAGTFVVGLLVGFVGQRMLDENLRPDEEKLKNQSQGAVNDR
jgi:NhaP-type Na+/H+ or K+/H+ antiporter